MSTGFNLNNYFPHKNFINRAIQFNGYFMLWQVPLKVNRTRHFPCSMKYHCYPVESIIGIQLKKRILNKMVRENIALSQAVAIFDKKFKIFIFIFFDFSSFFYIPLGCSFPATQMFFSIIIVPWTKNRNLGISLRVPLILNHVLHLNRCHIFLKLTNNSELKPSHNLIGKMTVKNNSFKCQNDCFLQRIKTPWK